MISLGLFPRRRRRCRQPHRCHRLAEQLTERLQRAEQLTEAERLKRAEQLMGNSRFGIVLIYFIMPLALFRPLARRRRP